MLPLETGRVWSFLSEQQALGGFVLIGGSALSLRIKHRVSEDLDLVWLEHRLPRSRLDAMARLATASGLVFEPADDEAAVWEFTDSGLELRDFQQGYLVGKVRVSFFAADPPLARVLSKQAEPKPRVATLPELFKAKCLVSAQRSKTRDWLDLFLLLRDHGFTLRDYRAAFVEAGIPSQCDIG